MEADESSTLACGLRKGKLSIRSIRKLHYLSIWIARLEEAHWCIFWTGRIAMLGLVLWSILLMGLHINLTNARSSLRKN